MFDSAKREHPNGMLHKAMTELAGIAGAVGPTPETPSRSIEPFERQPSSQPGEELSLVSVRRQLDQLMGVRNINELSPIWIARYEFLCEREIELLHLAQLEEGDPEHGPSF
jgi:hypothetical protein